MEIKTKHRKSAEQNRPKGRAMFALAERKEAPFAAMFAALTLAMAAYVKSAFGGTAQADEQISQPAAKAPLQEASVAALDEMEAPNPFADLVAPEKDQPLITAKLDEDGDLGRIGRGPGMLDLSRFFPEVEPTLDLPDAFLADQPNIANAAMPASMRADTGANSSQSSAGTGGAGSGGQANGGSGGGAGGNAGPGSDGAEDLDAMAGVNFHALFAQLAAVVRPFHPTTVRDISEAAIGDWVSQHELYRLRGGETRADMDAAYLAREERTYQMVTNPDSREAFIDQHFPTANTDMPAASLAEDVAAAAMQPEPLLSTDTNTGLL